MTGTATRTDLYATAELGPFARRDTAVYVLDPPHLGPDGVTTHVIVATNPAAQVVDIFPAYDDGRLAAWEPLNEEAVGVRDHAVALASIGYEVVTVDDRA